LPTDKVAYAGSSIDKVSYRFLDGRLLQMNLEFKRTFNAVRNPAGSPSGEQPDNVVFSALRLSLSEDLELSDPYTSETGSSSSPATQWDAGQDSLVLEENSTTDGATLTIFDQRVASTVIASKPSP